MILLKSAERRTTGFPDLIGVVRAADPNDSKAEVSVGAAFVGGSRANGGGLFLTLTEVDAAAVAETAEDEADWLSLRFLIAG